MKVSVERVAIADSAIVAWREDFKILDPSP